MLTMQPLELVNSEGEVFSLFRFHVCSRQGQVILPKVQSKIFLAANGVPQALSWIPLLLCCQIPCQYELFYLFIYFLLASLRCILFFLTLW